MGYLKISVQFTTLISRMQCDSASWRESLVTWANQTCPWPFRNIPLGGASWRWLVLKCKHPITGVTCYFVDKCLPFRSSISCRYFQEISDAIAHVVKFRTKKTTVNYLDDYLFASLLKVWCDWQVRSFLQVCNEIKFPVSLEKAEWGTTRLVFLGMLLDTGKSANLCSS